jgi:hypothetical protein
MINSKEGGYVTLVITMVILFIVTAIGLITAKMLVTEQQASINQIRYREAMSAAEAGLEAALVKLGQANTWRGMLTSSAAAPFYEVVIADSITIPSGSDTVRVIQLTSTGSSGGAVGSAASESNAILNQQAILDHVIAGAPGAPLVVAAGMASGGNFSVGANPNGGGAGVPLSIWSGSPVSIGASSQTCGLDEYYRGVCSSSPYTSKTVTGNDILVGNASASPPTFPPDLLQYVFGNKTVADIELMAGKNVFSNCDSLTVDSIGLYFINGDCTPPADVGCKKTDYPSCTHDINAVVLFVKDGNFRLNANRKFYGLVFNYDSYPDATPNYDITINGTATVFGAMVANYQLGKSNGTYNAVYDADVMNTIQTGEPFAKVYKIPGSWRDW